MKTFRCTLLVAALALLFALSLPACQSGDDDDNDNDATDDDDAADDDNDDDDDDNDDDTSPIDEVWVDTDSGLMWQNSLNVGSKGYTWKEAKNICRDLDCGGYDDWRLPTISEVRSLIRGCEATETGGSCGVTDSCVKETKCWDSSCNGCPGDAGPADGCYWPSQLNGDCGSYWSSSELTDILFSAWAAMLDRGVIYSNDVCFLSHARCVR